MSLARGKTVCRICARVRVIAAEPRDVRATTTRRVAPMTSPATKRDGAMISRAPRGPRAAAVMRGGRREKEVALEH